MSNNRPVVVFGTGDLADLATYYLQEAGGEVVAHTLDATHIGADEHQGRPVVPTTAVREQFPPDQYDMFVAIGYTGLNKARADRFWEMKSLGYRLISVISRQAIVPAALELGENCLIMESVTVQPFARIGHNNIFWSGCVVCHHVQISDHCFVGAHAVISGRCDVGERCFIGVNATIRDKVKLAPKTLVGAGAIVLSDTAENQSFLGTESRPSGIPSDRLQSLL